MGLFSRAPSGAKAVKPRLYATIDRATSEYLSAPNLAQNMDVVSTITQALDPTYASNKACKRMALRLRTRHQRIQYLTLQLLEHCIRSCGDPFHAELAKSPELLPEMIKMADRSVWCSTEINRLVLSLIQEWAHELDSSKYPQFSQNYQKLKQRGLPFEDRAAAERDGRFQPYPGLSPPSPAHQMHQAQGAGPQPGQFSRYPQPYPSRHGGQAAPTTNGERPASRGAQNLGPDLLKPTRSVPELKSDLEVAKGTIALLQEVLDGAEKDNNYAVVKEEYCAEVAGACEALQSRFAALLGSGVGDESVVSGALEMNEEAQRAVQRRMTMVEIADGRRPPPQLPRGNGNTTTDSTTTTSQQQKGNGRNATSAAAETETETAPAPFINLLDLDWTPPVAAAAAAEDTSATTSRVDPFLQPPKPVAPVPMNNPFAAAALGRPDNKMTEQLQENAPDNPFMNDDAFAQLSLQRSTSGTAVASPASAAPTEPKAQQAPPPRVSIPEPGSAPPGPISGNPFALADSSASTSFKRPAPVVLPTIDTSTNPYNTGPLTAPAGGAGGVTNPFSQTQQQQPLATTTGAYMPSSSYFGGPRSTVQPPSSSTSSFPGFGVKASSSTGSARPLGAPPGDAFGDLVNVKNLTPKAREEPAPLPPKGEPMRKTTSQNGSASGTPRADGAVTTQQQNNGVAQGNNDKTALSAFDAFDAIASR